MQMPSVRKNNMGMGVAIPSRSPMVFSVYRVWSFLSEGEAMNAAPKLRWYQFHLRSLFVAMTLACIGMSWVGVKMQQARRQKEAVEEIKKLGGDVSYDYQIDATGMWIQGGQPSNPMWLRSLLGDDLFTNVFIVQLDDTQVTDAGLEHLKGLTQLQELDLASTQVTDAGLENL
jgi:hypothetical protein